MLDFVPVELRSRSANTARCTAAFGSCARNRLLHPQHTGVTVQRRRVRRALDYALDRRVIAGTYGGPAAATPTCQAAARLVCPATAATARAPSRSRPKWRLECSRFSPAHIASSLPRHEGNQHHRLGALPSSPTIRPSAVRDVAGVLRRLRLSGAGAPTDARTGVSPPGPRREPSDRPGWVERCLPISGELPQPLDPLQRFPQRPPLLRPPRRQRDASRDVACPHRPARLGSALDAHRSQAHRPRSLAPAR